MPVPAGLTYGTGNDRVELLLTRLRPFAIRAVMSRSGTTYLYHHIRVSCDFIVNPGATIPPVFVRGQQHPRAARNAPWAPEAIPYLRYLLLRPRQKLLVTRGTTVVLESPMRTANRPQDDMPCDANGGPVPISCDFHEFIGDRTARGTYVVETWLSFSRGNAQGQVPTVLAHEWDTSSRLDPDTYLTTRTISGNIVLRRDLMEIRRIGNTTGLRPQDFWPSLAHPVPDRYQRVGLDVRYAADGTSIDYTLTDQQQVWCTLAGRGIIRVEGRTHQEVNWLQLGLPTAGSTQQIEAFGYPHCTSAQLVTVLASVYATMANGQGQPIAGQDRNLRPGLAEAVSVDVDYPRRHAALTVRRSTTGVPLGGVVLAGGALIRQLGGAASPAYFAENFGQMGGPAVTVSPAPLYNASTGDPLLALVTQALTGAGTEPVRPLNITYRRASDSTNVPG